MFGLPLDTERAFGEHDHMSRTRVRGSRAILLALVGAVLLGGPVARALAPTAMQPVTRRIYVVKPGDSLWSIATRVAAGRDPRLVVDAIGHRNHVVDGSIVPGQTLVIPAAA
jgi:hypothetical protein